MTQELLHRPNANAAGASRLGAIRFAVPLCALMLNGAIAATVLSAPALATEPQAGTQVAATVLPAEGADAPEIIHVPTLKDISTAPAGDEAIPPLEISAAEAQQWVLDAGYASVSPLELARTADGAPVYHGTATAQGEVYAVIVDSWGNIAGWR